MESILDLGFVIFLLGQIPMYFHFLKTETYDSNFNSRWGNLYYITISTIGSSMIMGNPLPFLLGLTLSIIILSFYKTNPKIKKRNSPESDRNSGIIVLTSSTTIGIFMWAISGLFWLSLITFTLNFIALIAMSEDVFDSIF